MRHPRNPTPSITLRPLSRPPEIPQFLNFSINLLADNEFCDSVFAVTTTFAAALPVAAVVGVTAAFAFAAVATPLGPCKDNNRSVGEKNSLCAVIGVHTTTGLPSSDTLL
jgi:hypothetical protein